MLAAIRSEAGPSAHARNGPPALDALQVRGPHHGTGMLVQGSGSVVLGLRFRGQGASFRS